MRDLRNTARYLTRGLSPVYDCPMRTFKQYVESQTVKALPRWEYILHLAETMDAPEIAKLLGVSRQRVYQLLRKAKAVKA